MEIRRLIRPGHCRQQAAVLRLAVPRNANITARQELRYTIHVVVHPHVPANAVGCLMVAAGHATRPAAATGRLTGWGAAVRNATGPVRVCRGTAGSVLTIRPAMTEGR